MPLLWPLRTGNDERFQVATESIYDPIRDDLPPNTFGTELSNYLQGRWRRGMVQQVVPTTCYGAIAGFCVGFRQSRVEGRYVGRYKIMWRYTSTFAAVGLLTTSLHQFLVVRNQYRDAFYYPLVAGAMGAAILTVASQMGTIGQGLFVGSFLGVLYSLGCYGMAYYHRRRLKNFFYQQQLQQVPIYKVSPELQPVYRAFLFDNRPLEETDRRQRESMMISRSVDESRLDARTFMENSTPEVFEWVNFPEWWPLKWPVQTEMEQLLLDRQRREEVERRKNTFLSTEDGALLKRKNRAKEFRDA
eukprot:gene7255-5102_t